MAEESELWSSSTPFGECFEQLVCVDAVHNMLLPSSAALHTHLHLSVIYHMDDKRNNMASGAGCYPALYVSSSPRYADADALQQLAW